LRDKDSNQGTEDEYRGCYLIGLRKIENREDHPTSDSDRKLAQNTLRTILDGFANQIRGDEKYFDPGSSWVDVSHVKQADLGELQLDEREWGAHVTKGYRSDVEDLDKAEDTGIDIIFTNDSGDELEELTVTKMKSKTTPAFKGSKASTKPVSLNKLRPASDILSRLRWDPDFDSRDYVVGYVDRFLGTKETGLESWKSEQTDEEFIPQHRIVYFKRRSDGVRVWDRETRLDLVFGSGIGSG
jgi:uncharacterized protein (UPF0248 family)